MGSLWVMTGVAVGAPEDGAEVDPLLVGWGAFLIVVVVAGLVTLLKNRGRDAPRPWRIAGYVAGGLCLGVGILGLAGSLLLAGAGQTGALGTGLLVYGSLAILGVADIVAAAPRRRR